MKDEFDKQARFFQLGEQYSWPVNVFSGDSAALPIASAMEDQRVPR